ncbi:2-oxoglutarate and iron-dependent oxygenase domain-containing protein 3-like protein, partial [Leptotrombidium deliense]
FHEVNCSEKGYRNEQLLGSAPNHCGVVVDDLLIEGKDALKLRGIIEKSIENFGFTREEAPENVNIKRIKLFEFVIRGLRNRVIAESDYELIKLVSERIKKSVSSSFGIQEKNLFFTPICEATRFKPIVAFQEFRHVDKVRSPPLVVTSIIWLSTHGEHFSGGRLHFLMNNSLLIEPKLGRFAAWSSSYECPHEVQELISGERYALLFAFTVDPNSGHQSVDEMRHWYSSRV